jgi:hypothetical protein
MHAARGTAQAIAVRGQPRPAPRRERGLDEEDLTMSLHTIPPHEPYSFRLLLPNDAVAVIRYRDLAPETLADLERALGAVGAKALEHKEELERYRATRALSE